MWTSNVHEFPNCQNQENKPETKVTRLRAPFIRDESGEEFQNYRLEGAELLAEYLFCCLSTIPWVLLRWLKQ